MHNRNVQIKRENFVVQVNQSYFSHRSHHLYKMTVARTCNITKLVLLLVAMVMVATSSAFNDDEALLNEFPSYSNYLQGMDTHLFCDESANLETRIRMTESETCACMCIYMQ